MDGSFHGRPITETLLPERNAAVNKIKLNLPPAASIVFDNLYDVMPLASLGEDLCVVQLPGNRYIDIGWFPHRMRKAAM